MTGKTVIPLTSAILSASQMSFIIKHYTNLCLTFLPLQDANNEYYHG